MACTTSSVQLCENEKCKYLKKLENIDQQLVIKIAKYFDEIKTIFQNGLLFSKESIYPSVFSHDFYDEWLDVTISDEDKQKDEFKLIKCFQHISECTQLLNRHEKSIKLQLKKFINWDILQGIEIALKSHPLWLTDKFKLFESISSDCLHLQKIFCEVCQRLEQSDDIQKAFTDFSKCQLSVLQEYTLSKLSKHLAKRSLEIIDIINTLENLDQEDEQIVMFHCLQLIGDIYLSFPEKIRLVLDSWKLYRLKNFRNGIKNHWENTIRANDFLDNVKKNNYLEALQKIPNLLNNYYKPILIDIIDDRDLSNILDEKLKEIDELSSPLAKHLPTKTQTIIDLNSTPQSYITKQIKLLLHCIDEIRRILIRCKRDPSSICEQLRLPKNHYGCLFFLTLIGSTVQNMRVKDLFLSTVPCGLHEKLDYLRWIRNSLMHYEEHLRSNFYRNTLFDYLSNDLLIEEYSIDYNGQLMLQFEQYFNNLENELKDYSNSLNSLNNLDNVYTGDDVKFYDIDVTRKNKKINKFFSKLEDTNIKASNDRSNMLTMEEFMWIIDDISEKCKNLDIKCIGVFGPLVKHGSTQNNSPSGIVIEKDGKPISDETFYQNLMELKKYLKNRILKGHLRVVELHQMEEYIRFKTQKKVNINVREKISKYSCECLQNGSELKYLIESACKSDPYFNSSKELIDNLLTPQNSIYYEYRTSFEDEPLLHKLIEIVLSEKKYSSSIRDYFRSIINRIIEDNAEINIQDHLGHTFLHVITRFTAENQSISLDSLKSENFYRKLNANIFDGDGMIPLSYALIHNRIPLKFELRELTNLFQHANNLIDASIQGNDLDFLRYLLSDARDEKDEKISLIGRYRNDKKSFIHRLFDKQFSNGKHENMKNFVKFLLENHIELTSQDGSTCDYEKLLIYLLKNRLNCLVLNLLKRLAYVDFLHIDKNKDYPIHVALDNLIDCKNHSERPIYLKIVEEIINHSKKLNYERQCNGDTPLYRAAKNGELDVVKLLLKQTNKVAINYKIGRYHHNMCSEAPQNEFEIIILLLEHGLTCQLSDNLDCIQNLRLQDFLFQCESLFLNYIYQVEENRNELSRVLTEKPDMRRFLCNRRNKRNKNLLWYAIKYNDIEVIELILKYEFPSANIDVQDIQRSYNEYIYHLSCCATGDMIQLFHKYHCISWCSMDFSNMVQMTNSALKKNDKKLFHLIEEHCYPTIDFKWKDHAFVDVYLKTFRKLQKDVTLNNRKYIRQLPNQQVLFQYKKKYPYSTILSIAVQKNKFSIVKYLIEELHYNIHAVSYSPRHGKISALDDFIRFKNGNFKMLQYLLEKQVYLYDITTFSCNIPFSEYINNEIRLYIDNNEKNCKSFYKSINEQHLKQSKFVEFLLSLSTWDPNRYDTEGYTPLHWCVTRKNNATVRVLCNSKRVDVEQLTDNSLFALTTGNRTAVGLALEAKNWEGARILVQEYDASPYRYLLVLLIYALGNDDFFYVEKLLQKSIIPDPDSARFFLRNYSNETKEENIIEFPILKRAFHNAQQPPKNLDIPDFIVKDICEYYKRHESIVP